LLIFLSYLLGASSRAAAYAKALPRAATGAVPAAEAPFSPQRQERLRPREARAAGRR